jgi:hypothetical protein
VPARARDARTRRCRVGRRGRALSVGWMGGGAGRLHCSVRSRRGARGLGDWQMAAARGGIGAGR